MLTCLTAMTRQIVSLMIALLLHILVLYAVAGYLENNSLATGGGARSLQITMSGISTEPDQPEKETTITGSAARQKVVPSEVVAASPSEPLIAEPDFSEINASVQKIPLSDAPVSTTSIISKSSILKSSVSGAVKPTLAKPTQKPEKTIQPVSKPKQTLAVQKPAKSRDNPSNNQADKKASSVVQRSIMDQSAAQLAVVQNQDRQTRKVKEKVKVEGQARTVAAVGSTPQATVGQSKTEVEGSKSAATGGSLLKQQAEKLEANYRTELVNAISRYKRYPMRARKKGNEGDVVVAFTIEKDGRITGIAVVESSSWSSLDRAAVRALEKLNRFKPIPDSFFRKQWSFQIPIKFSLQS